MAVSGYPFAFRIDFAAARLEDRGLAPAPVLEFPILAATALPWNLEEWRLSAPKGFSARLSPRPSAAPAPFLLAKRATGLLSLFRNGAAKLSLRIEKASAFSFAADRAALALALPAGASPAKGAGAVSLSLALKELKLPFNLSPFGATISDLSFALTLKGRVASGPLLLMAKAWQKDGGRVDLDRLHLVWGVLAATLSGRLGLDRALQPQGAFKATIEGYDAVLGALVANGRMRPKAASIARIALRLLSERGPEGKREIVTSLKIEKGAFYLGPARLGPAPHLSWPAASAIQGRASGGASSRRAMP